MLAGELVKVNLSCGLLVSLDDIKNLVQCVACQSSRARIGTGALPGESDSHGSSFDILDARR